MSLRDFASTYTVHTQRSRTTSGAVSTRLQQRQKRIVVRLVPRPSSDPDGGAYAEFCEYALLQWQPWENSRPVFDADEVQLRWLAFVSSQPKSHAVHTWLDVYNACDLVGFFEPLGGGAAAAADDVADGDDVPQHNPLGDDMYDGAPLASDNIAPIVDWSSEYDGYICANAPRWLQERKSEPLHSPVSAAVTPDQLNNDQRRAYDIIAVHAAQAPAADPLRMMILGTAGTGKSHTIRALAGLLGRRLSLTGTTGMAAFQIGGRTIHSLLRLPCKTSNRQLAEAIRSLTSRGPARRGLHSH